MRRGYFTPPVLIILAIIIFAVAILIAINTDLVKRSQKEPTPTPVSSPIVQISISESSETANWKTYINSTHEFSIKYPEELMIKERINGDVEFYDEEDLSNLEKGRTPSLFNTMDINTRELVPTAENKNIEKVKINNADGIVWKVNEVNGTNLPIYYLLSKNRTYNLGLSSGSAISPNLYAEDVFNKKKEIYYLMVSTFRFLD
ncbi:MAG TPA: hypothetical protein VJ065_03345 [Patescibacteria group bacterium]|nr:hypothetical protein [Patescibacteria group bacterium]